MTRVGGLPAARRGRLARRHREDRGHAAAGLARHRGLRERRDLGLAHARLRELLDGRLDDVGEPRGAPDRVDLERQLDAPGGDDELVDRDELGAVGPQDVGDRDRQRRGLDADAPGAAGEPARAPPSAPPPGRAPARSRTSGTAPRARGSARRAPHESSRPAASRRPARARAARGRPRTGSRRATPRATDRTGRAAPASPGWLSTARSRPASASAPRSRSISSCMTRKPTAGTGRTRQERPSGTRRECHLAVQRPQDAAGRPCAATMRS